MFKRLILIGAFAISIVPLFGSNANAQFFDGWGWFGFSALRGEIDLSKVPNPGSKPRIVFVEGILSSIEVLCRNPASHVVAPGNAGTQTATGGVAIGGDNISDRKRGLAHVTVFVGESALAAAEATATCNNNWSVIEGSAAAKQMQLTMNIFGCAPESKDDPEPCFLGTSETLTLDTTINPDTVKLLCTIDPVARDSFGIPLHNQHISCNEV